MEYLVTALVNVEEDEYGRSLGMMDGYFPHHKLATVAYFDIVADNAHAAAERMFTIGNRMGADINGDEWPSDVRSLSVGDVLFIAGGNKMETVSLDFLAVDRFGFKDIQLPANSRFVPINGTHATSRA